MRLLLKSILLCSVLIQFGLASCSGGQHQGDEELEGLPDDFRKFYLHFHQDSAFQIAHIVFPLPGIPGRIDVDSSGVTATWEKETWKMHQRIYNIGDYHHTFDVLSNDLIVETIEERNAPIAMQRRFARMATGWHLIYYIEMQPLSRQEGK